MAMSVDTTTLTIMISALVDDSMDDRFTDQQKLQCMVLAKRLRGTLVNLLSVRFNDGTARVTRANADLSAINTQVQEVSANLESFAETAANVAGLVAQLDDLLTLAVKFA
ncbi:MAG: hypothetical protein JSR66_23705 [Proteobacteria bacterium]|nr:hypothetical protein [Pseudomonadota bacterium]